MTNADKFKSLFGLYATELWAMPEKDFLKWLNSEAMNCSEFPNNSDTISRQAAIDAMCELMHHWFGGDPKDEVREIKRELEKLPAVQPQPVVRCKDCRYQDKGCNESESWNLCGYRPWLHVPTEDEHYCGYAERRTDEQNS